MLLILRNNIDQAGETPPPGPVVVSTLGSFGVTHVTHTKPQRARLPPEVQRLLMAEVRRRVKEELERREMTTALRRATRPHKK